MPFQVMGNEVACAKKSYSLLVGEGVCADRRTRFFIFLQKI